jgi:hypothetical protein
MKNKSMGLVNKNDLGHVKSNGIKLFKKSDDLLKKQTNKQQKSFIFLFE